MSEKNIEITSFNARSPEEWINDECSHLDALIVIKHHDGSIHLYNKRTEVYYFLTEPRENLNVN